MDSTDLTHAFAVFALFGLIWTIQLVHYPAFRFIEPSQWTRFHQQHSRNVTFIVFPLMLIELLTSIQLILEDFSIPHVLFGACACLSWLLTIFLFVPLHNKLSTRPLQNTISLLIRLNWLRTSIWTVSAVTVFVSLLAKSVS